MTPSEAMCRCEGGAAAESPTVVDLAGNPTPPSQWGILKAKSTVLDVDKTVLHLVGKGINHLILCCNYTYVITKCEI